MSTELSSKSAEQQSVKAQIESANRQLRLIDLSRQQLETEKSDVVWQGVGKMFVKKDKTSYLEELTKDKKKGEEALDTLKKEADLRGCFCGERPKASRAATQGCWSGTMNGTDLSQERL